MSKILVLEDDSATLDVIKLLFELEGYQVLGISDHSILFDAIEKYLPSVILMDVIIGQADGRDICQLLKSSVYKDIPVLLMSVVNNFHSDLEHPMIADDYIDKPFDLDVMVSKVKTLIDNSN
ncbi:response regulator transcription factor [Pedobacter frigidisoli]|uniref:Response regulator transcription factor n=1 Tax=Pedobacter frigidisoli TaxID=2530455 RepID=A0A4R0NQS7_9SPHI|nr:response regulator [Pedobacter frigidisoli]TCD02153.1 response regulator transcription factor [Pedobacter frigidisoli]